jgi:1-deoxy-D-xylulose-5-phosphate reductoisomerase
MDSGVRPLDLSLVKTLSFEKPDAARFPCLGLAYAALRAGGAAPVVLNAANEIAVEAFLAGRLSFTAIPDVIEETLQGISLSRCEDLDSIMHADAAARRHASEQVRIAA